MNSYNVLGCLILIGAGLGISANPFIPWPSLVFREGGDAEIPCLTTGESDILTWTTSSGKIITSVTNEPGISGHFSVGPNGTLFIDNVTLEDEGNYYCRQVSESRDNEIGISVLVQDQRAQLFIDQCQPHRECALPIGNGELTSSLECTALYVSPHTVLKWFRGEQELEGISEYSPRNYSFSVNISSKLTGATVLGNQTTLRCLAVDERVFQAEGMHAYVFLLEENDSDDDDSWTYIISAVLGLVLFSSVVMCVICLISRKIKRKESLTQPERYPNETQMREREKVNEQQRLLEEDESINQQSQESKDQDNNEEQDKPNDQQAQESNQLNQELLLNEKKLLALQDRYRRLEEDFNKKQQQVEPPVASSSPKETISKDQLLEVLDRNIRLKENMYKVDPVLLLRLREVVDKQSWADYLYTFLKEDVTNALDKEIEKFEELLYVNERTTDLQRESTECMKYLLQNSVDGLHSCIIFHFEAPDTNIVTNMETVCSCLYGIVEKLQRKGLQVNTGINCYKLNNVLKKEGATTEPKDVPSKADAVKYISEKFHSTSPPLSIEFHLASSIASTDPVSGFLNLVVLKDEESLTRAFATELHRKSTLTKTQTQLCRSLVVMDGTLGDTAGRQRIISILDTINKLREATH